MNRVYMWRYELLRTGYIIFHREHRYHQEGHAIA
jgi:hypothetical protein